MPSLTREVPHNSELERNILKEMQLRVRYWERIVQSKFSKWRDAEERILAYIPERDVDTLRRTSREGGLPQYTTIQIPYSYAVVMAAHTYLTSVFLGRDPVFQFSGRHGESQQQVQAMEALISYQVLVGRMLPYIYTWIYDALKYGQGVTGTFWDERINTVSEIQQVPKELDPLTGQPLSFEKLQISEQVRSYAGNRIYNIQPQDFIWDVRHTIREFQSGEFCGERRKVAWNEIIRAKKRGYLMNTEHIRSGRGADYFIPTDSGSSQLERPEVFQNYGSTVGELGNSLNHPMMVGCYRLVMEILPDEWKLGSSDFPEKWVFTCTDDFSVLIGAQPLGARHCQFPYNVIPLEPEGYGLTTRGLPEILEPVQQTIDWLVNSHFYNVRAALNDRFVVDPSQVVMKDVLDPLPGKIIRLRPEAYGRDPKLAVAQFPTSNVTQGQISVDLPMMFGFGERTGGVNDQVMGMLDTGGRKTATEVRTSTSFSVNRLKTVAEFSSATGFDPLSMMLVQNTQQFYDMELKFKIAGDLAMNAGQSFMNVRPEDIGGFYNFVPVDGTLPIDRMAMVGIWQQLFQSILTVPQIGMQYDLGGIFTWVAQLAGLKNITQFKIQLTPDEVMLAQAAAGNAVPMTPPSSAAKSNGSAPGANLMQGAA